jgi:hypothetical protein
MKKALILAFAVLAFAACAKNGDGKHLKFIPDASDFPHPPTDPDNKPAPPPKPQPPPLLSLTNNVSSVYNNLSLSLDGDEISGLTYTTVDGSNQKIANYSADELESANGVILEGTQANKELVLKAQFTETSNSGSMSFIFPRTSVRAATTCKVALRKISDKWRVISPITRKTIRTAEVVRSPKGGIQTIDGLCKSSE